MPYNKIFLCSNKLENLDDMKTLQSKCKDRYQFSNLFSKFCWSNWIFIGKKEKTPPKPHTLHKSYFQMYHRFMHKLKTIKPLEVNTGEKPILCDWTEFLDIS